MSDVSAARHRAPVRLWEPCRLGHPDPETCPNCTPPADERCPEYREVYVGNASNDPSDWVGYNVRRPCRVLGSHEFHRDGLGTTWWPDEYEPRHRSDDGDPA